MQREKFEQVQGKYSSRCGKVNKMSAKENKIINLT